MTDFTKMKEAMGELDSDTLMEMLNAVMAEGGSGAFEAMEACQQGMAIVGEFFETGEYFVGDLICAGDLMMQAVDILSPALTSQTGEGHGKMILCTVEGDLHDIGKNIVKAMLEASGVEVVDLGIDVPPAKIVEKAREENIKIIGLSGVLTIAIDSMRKTVEAFKDAGLRDNVKVIVGGAPINELVCERIEADSWSLNPQKTVEICREWLKA